MILCCLAEPILIIPIYVVIFVNSQAYYDNFIIIIMSIRNEGVIGMKHCLWRLLSVQINVAMDNVVSLLHSIETKLLSTIGNLHFANK